MLFEIKMNHCGKGLTGIDLSNSLAHDEIVMIRAIEREASAITKDPEILFPCNCDRKKIIHIYKEYCATRCTEKRNEKGEIIDLPNVSASVIKEAIDLAFLYS